MLPLNFLGFLSLPVVDKGQAKIAFSGEFVELKERAKTLCNKLIKICSFTIWFYAATVYGEGLPVNYFKIFIKISIWDWERVREDYYKWNSESERK